jgi:hypothetical protein
MLNQKKGMLLATETLKIVLSVISISLLAFLLYSLYYSGIDKQNEKAAEASLERFSEVVRELKTNSEFVGSVDGLTPSGWYLFSFVDEEKKPNQCVGGNCFCICKNAALFGDLFDGQIKKCDDGGKCLVVSNLEEFGKIRWEN